MRLSCAFIEFRFIGSLRHISGRSRRKQCPLFLLSHWIVPQSFGKREISKKGMSPDVISDHITWLQDVWSVLSQNFRTLARSGVRYGTLKAEETKKLPHFRGFWHQFSGHHNEMHSSYLVTTNELSWPQFVWKISLLVNFGIFIEKQLICSDQIASMHLIVMPWKLVPKPPTLGQIFLLFCLFKVPYLTPQSS